MVRLVNYLETISGQLVIDLIAISAYTVNGSQILVPQRVEAERQRAEPSSSTAVRSTGEGWLADGAADFIASIDAAPETSKSLLQRLCNWAITLEKEHLVKLSTYFPQSGPQARQRNYEWMSVAMR